MTKTIILSLILAISAWADGQLCYQPDSTQPDQQICMVVSADAQAAVQNYVDSPNNQTTATVDGKSVSTPKYLGIGDAIFFNVNMFFQGALANFPPDSVKAVIDAETAKVEAIKTAVLQAAPIPEKQPDPGKVVNPGPLPVERIK
jgi:hypothetical protein